MRRRRKQEKERKMGEGKRAQRNAAKKRPQLAVQIGKKSQAKELRPHLSRGEDWGRGNRTK